MGHASELHNRKWASKNEKSIFKLDFLKIIFSTVLPFRCRRRRMSPARRNAKI